ncbi:hypothetical protein COLO4_30075 [Corchorus olitorius]|uniref:RNase H type-1 domain-containing protein n=1 Tax=Corchorus olitorius TaxID=93759 RepID=A0A1R3HB87_9ROSI|nr:hypothetical protein COLO4_30075 [Corchorus olitorius]
MVNKNTRKEGVGVVARNEGALVGGLGKKVTASSSGMVEILAIEEGIKLAKDNGWDKVVIETDSKEALKTIQVWSKDFNMRWVPNGAAHWVAVSTRKGMCTHDWVQTPPSSLLLLLTKDGLNG